MLRSGTLASKNIFQYMTRLYFLSGKKGGVVLVVMLEDYYSMFIIAENLSGMTVCVCVCVFVPLIHEESA